MNALALSPLALVLYLQQQPAWPPPGPPPAPPAWGEPAPAYPPQSPYPQSAYPQSGYPPPPAYAPAPAYPPPPPYAPPPAYPPVEATVTGSLPRTGLFGVGLGLDPLQLGPMQVYSAGGSSNGVAGGIGVEIDLGPHLALRIPLEIDYAGSSSTDASGVEQSSLFVYAGLSPGVTYRFRSERDQTWVPFVGGAVKLGAFMFGRRLLGVAPNPPPSTMQEFARAGVAPDLTAGVLYTPARWFALRLCLDYTYIYVAHTSVHALAETIAPQFSF